MHQSVAAKNMGFMAAQIMQDIDDRMQVAVATLHTRVDQIERRPPPLPVMIPADPMLEVQLKKIQKECDETKISCDEHEQMVRLIELKQKKSAEKNDRRLAEVDAKLKKMRQEMTEKDIMMTEMRVRLNEMMKMLIKKPKSSPRPARARAPAAPTTPTTPMAERVCKKTTPESSSMAGRLPMDIKKETGFSSERHEKRRVGAHTVSGTEKKVVSGGFELATSSSHIFPLTQGKVGSKRPALPGVEDGMGLDFLTTHIKKEVERAISERGSGSDHKTPPDNKKGV